MSTSDNFSSVHDYLTVQAPTDPPIEPFPIYQSALDHPPQPISPSPNSPLSDYPQYQPLAEPLVPEPNMTFLVSVSEAEVEVDPEVWIPVTYRRNRSTCTYYAIQVPKSSGNVLIAGSNHDYDEWIHVPDSFERRWPILISKKHTPQNVPPEFQEWMGPIQVFLDKSAEYLRPYENYVKKRRIISGFCVLVGMAIIMIASILNKELYETASLWGLLAAIIFMLVAMLLNIFIKRGLANGVKALKLCGKYEKSVLPMNIKVVLGPYGAYWKFVLRS